MRYTYLFLILVLLLAACGGGKDEPTEVPTELSNLFVRPTQVLSETEIAQGLTPEEEASFGEELLSIIEPQQPLPPATATLVGEGALPIPGPGTLVASETEDPGIPPGFDLITLEQTGGLNNVSLDIEIMSDLTVMINGQGPFAISQETVDQLGVMVDDLNFFGLQGTFLGPSASEETYRYRVSVSSGDIARAINAQDGFIPEQFARFLSTIQSVASDVIQREGLNFEIEPAAS